jgi:7,8-dihydro-6-hydroxymethylpterin-pyrophosphokinase
MGERDFVLRPLSDVAPEWRHPKTEKTADEMRKLLPAGTMTCLGRILS